MSTTYSTAIKSMFSLFFTAWQAGATSIVGYIPNINWPGIEKPTKEDASKFWARVSQQTVDEGQTALAGAGSRRRYTAKGLIFIQLFCPKTDSRSIDLGRSLAVLARDSFRGKISTENVWFRNVRIQELDAEESYHRFNVVVEYEYDEMG
jgi:hypothetical protein